MADQPSPTVLVVDDDPIALEVTRERLESRGYAVVTREKSLGTSQWIMQHHPDCVLLDVMMPALSGSDLATVLRSRGLKTGVILYSSKPQSEIDALVRETGAIGGISKGKPPEQFLSEFDRLLASIRGPLRPAPR